MSIESAAKTHVLVDARVRTMTEGAPVAEAIGWRGESIVAVGSRDEVLAAAGDEAVVVDVGGAAVLPGFVDAHHHVSLSVLYGGTARLTAPVVHDIVSLLDALRQAAQPLTPGRWLVAMEWDEMLLAEGRPPSLRELDEAVPDRPLFALHYSGHRALANSHALELAGIGRGSSDPPGGVISRDEQGAPNGLLIERGMSPVEALARPDIVGFGREAYLARLAEHYRALVAVGITFVADTTVPSDLLELFRECKGRGELLVPTLACPVSTRGYLEEPWQALDGPVTGEGDDLLRVGPVKLVFDGAPSCSMCLGLWQVVGVLARTCALSLRLGSFDPVHTAMSLRPRFERDLKMHSGVTIYTPSDAERVVRGVVDRGFAVATHAIGNQAVEVALGAYQHAGPGLHAAGRPRLEHGAFLNGELVSRIADAGVAIVTQPNFLTLPAWESAASIPGLRFFPHRWLLDAGVLVAGSSDFPVAGYDPLDGMRRAVWRLTARGSVHEGDQRIGLEESLAMYTRSGAEACGVLDRRGTLTAGKRADLVVLDSALDTVAQLATCRVRATVIGGELAYGRYA